MMNINSKLAADLAASTRAYINDYDLCAPAERYLLDVEAEVIKAAMHQLHSCSLRWCISLDEEDQIRVLDELKDNYCNCWLDNYNKLLTLRW